MNQFLIFGHRGSPRRFPENTPDSFEEALRAGADGFETDLRFLSDRVAVLYHDDELDEDDIESLTSRHFAEKGMTLQRVSQLAAFAARTTMILEVKRGQWEDALLAEIESWPNVIVTSFDHASIAELARRGVRFPLGIVYYGRIVGAAEYARRIGATFACPNHHFVDAVLVDEMHAAGVLVVPWTANRERDWQRLRAAGCDGVITDLPAEAVAWRGRG
jgi:glycerophosphoryl diester phosphodiesterase